MPAYNVDLARFAGYDAQVVGMSVDSVYCHLAWVKREIGLLDFPLGSDFYPHGDVARKFGILREGPPVPGMNERAIFIVNKEGRIAWAKQYEIGEQPPNEELFAALEQVSQAEKAGATMGATQP
jgi:alkyl hydroperoxide reductase subunit AhpC